MSAAVAPASPREVALDRARDRRAIWWYAIAAWLSQRVVIGACVFLWQRAWGSHALPPITAILTQYDGNWYVGIARDGYHTIGQAAYFPLFPALIWGVAPLAAGNTALAGVIVANVAALGAFVALGYLVEEQFGARVAGRTLLYYAILPTGFYLAAAYTESIFLLLSVAAFLCMRRRRWLLTGALITLATLTRAPGVLLTVPLAIEAWRALRLEWAGAWTWPLRRMTVALACALTAPFLAILGFQLYLTQLYGVSDVMSRALALPQWRRSPDWPWSGLFSDLDLARQFSHGLQAPVDAPLVAIDVISLALWLGLCLYMVAPKRIAPIRLPLSWTTYSWVALLQVLILSSHVPGHGLISLPRYIIVIFPCLVALAMISVKFPRAHLVMFALSLAALIFLVSIFCNGGFVA